MKESKVISNANKGIETRKKAIESLIKDINAHKSVKNVTVVIDYVKDSEKSASLLSSENTVATRTSLDKYDLIHIYTTDTRKQLFYIRTNSKQFKFVVSPRIASQIKDNAIFKHSTHKEDNLYFVAHKDGWKMFSIVLDAMKKASEKSLNKETTVSKETTVNKEKETEKAN